MVVCLGLFFILWGGGGGGYKLIYALLIRGNFWYCSYAVTFPEEVCVQEKWGRIVILRGGVGNFSGW